MVFDGGIYLFTLMDWNTASWAILLIGIAEVGVVGWCYGCNKFLRNIAEMQMRFNLLLRRYWWLSWVVLAPVTCLVSVITIATYPIPVPLEAKLCEQVIITRYRRLIKSISNLFLP